MDDRYTSARSLVKAALLAIAVRDNSSDLKSLANGADDYLDSFGGDWVTAKGERMLLLDVGDPKRVPDKIDKVIVDGAAVRRPVWRDARFIAWQLEHHDLEETIINELVSEEDLGAEDGLAEWFLMLLRQHESLMETLTAKPNEPWVECLTAPQAWGDLPSDLVASARQVVGTRFSVFMRSHRTLNTRELSEHLVVIGLEVCGNPKARYVFDGWRHIVKRRGSDVEHVAPGAPVSRKVRATKRRIRLA